MKRNHFLRNTTAVILSILMGLLLPVQVYASTLPEDDDTIYASFDDIQTETETIGNILYELEAERDEYSKTFLLDDGTTMLAEYNQPVHFKDDNENWTEYDNSLTTATADEATPEYSNKASDIKVKLSQKAKKSNMIKLQSDDYKISWGYENANKSTGVINRSSEKLSGNEKFTTLENAVSEVTYSEVYQDVDLQYFITSTGVKENIILKSANTPNEFNVNYKINNLTAKQTDETTIGLYNKNGDEVYTIEAPYMVDSNGNTSTQLKLEIVEQKGSNLQVKLTADYWFIHSFGRAFPITIDPEVSKKLTTGITFTTILNNSKLSYGPYYTAANAYCLIKISNLPEFEVNERIVNATFDLDISNGSSLFTNTNDAVIANLHRGSTSSPYYSRDILDYDAVTPDSYDYVHFDITKLMRQWYDETVANDGFVIEALDTVGSRKLTFNQASRTSVNPTLKIVYKDFSGTEDNLSYHTVSVGNKIQAQVSDYLGNLVIKQSFYEGTGSRMPATITATYNSVNYNAELDYNSPSANCWQFSFEQYVREAGTDLSAMGYNYIYTDADGTDHYMKKSDDSEEWIDEDGLGLTLTKDKSNIYIDNGTIKQTYALTSAGGKLLSEKDEYNNTITYGYTDGNLTTITDGSGRKTTLSYVNNSAGKKRLRNIKTPDSGSIDISYTTTLRDKISSITFNSQKITKFEYDSSERLVSVIESDIYSTPQQQSKYTFTYTDGKVTKITEYGRDNTEGNYLNIQYGNDNTTTFTDRQGRSETYTFDNYGNKISTLNANGYITNESGSGLSASSGADSFTKNYITQSTEQSAIGSGSGNYFFVVNGDKSGVKSKGGTCTIDTSDPTEEDGYTQYFGTTSLKVTNPASTDNSAFFTGVAHEFKNTYFNGKDITFSAYVKTKNVKQIYSDGAVGAILKIKCFDSSGNRLEELNSVGIDGTQDWQRLSVTATIPEKTSNFKVYCMIRYASGTVWFDCLQLEEGNCANDFNALQNADLTTNSNWLTNNNTAIVSSNGTVTIYGQAGAFPHEEQGDTTGDTDSEDKGTEDTTQPETIVKTDTETESCDSVTTYDDYGNAIKTMHGNVIKKVKKTYLKNTPDTTVEPTEDSSNDDNIYTENVLIGNRYIYQIVNVDRAGVQFNVSGLAKAKSVPLSNSNRTFGMAMNIYYENKENPETHYQSFNVCTSEKQSVTMNVTPENTKDIIDYVAIAFVYGYNENEMTVYDANLNIATVSYSVSDDADTDGNIPNTEEDNCIDYEVVSESVDTEKTYMQTSVKYDNTGNYVAARTNEAGNTVSYTYDVNGNVTSKTDGNENIVNYTYDKENNLLGISSYEAGNTYTYNGAGNVSSISHNGFSYEFNYDVFNNIISTTIGNVIIVNNTYFANNGNLKRTNFANGDYIEYTYDKYDNITRITGETGTIAEFVYNKKGLIAKTIDNSSDETTYYYYDFYGNPINQYTQSEDESLVKYTSCDENGNSIEKTIVNGQTKTITTGTDEDGNSFVSNDGVKAEKITDDFGRTTQVKTSSGEGSSVFFTDYEYAKGKLQNSTTKQVSKLTHTYGTNSLAQYEYTYDNNGNIMIVKQGGKTVQLNSYDELNQLIWSGDTYTGLYVNYIYDKAGNITKVREYTLNSTSWTPGSLVSERTYSYTDTKWKDKLTSYNGTDIEYDEVGNPTSYRDEMNFTWENGRILKSISKGSTTLNMKYNSNGMRTQKSDNNGTTNYYYDSNNNLIGLTKGNNTLFFYYDSDNSPTSFSYNGTMYYYIKNLQGDVVKIIDQAGTVVANYIYDAWGNILSETGDSNINSLNPFRYRSYVYDTETGLYYLQSRYYDPLTGRFLNADVLCDTEKTVLGTNMYAYCENNPVNNTDKSGNFLFTITYNVVLNMLLPTSNIRFLYVTISFWTSWNNYWYNESFFFDDFIYNQRVGDASKIRMGFYTGDYNGCGWIATYNALRLLQPCYPGQPAGIVSFYEAWGCVLNGKFGILPDAIADYFRLIGYRYVDSVLTTDSNGMDTFIDNHRVTIFFFWTGSSGHYVTVCKKGGYYYSYNLKSDRNSSLWHYTSFQSDFQSNKEYQLIASIGIK